MSTPKYPELFPPALGNEEESMLLTGRDESNLDDPIGFVSAFSDYMPADIKKTEGWRKFMQNGGLMYDGGASDDDAELFSESVNLERATPECATPAEFATYIQANEMIYVEMLKNYVFRRAKAGHPEMARAQRRTIDAYGNGRACHDSIESKRPEWFADFENNSDARSVLLSYLETRSFVTGAGYVSETGAHFAQKVQYLTKLKEYGYVNSAYRNASETDTGPRLEVRCNDINISPWAIQARIGGSAVLFTMLQTPLVNSLAEYVPADVSDSEHIANFQRYNHVDFTQDGQITPNADIVRALGFQERVFELADEELGYFVDLPHHYKQLIWEMRYYFEDFRKLLSGDLQLTDLADRSDMAAKFARIFELQQRAEAYGVERKLGDFASRAADMRYDNITVKLDGNGQPVVKYGYGYQRRDKGKFRMTIPQTNVGHAMYHPPTTTRAKIRGTFIRQDEVKECGWAAVKHEGLGSVIKLNEVILSDSTPDVLGKP